MATKKNPKKEESGFNIEEFKELPDNEKKRVISLLNKKVKINLDAVSDGTKKHVNSLESKFPNGEVIVTHIYYNGEIRVESLKNKINHITTNYKNVEKILK